MAIYTDSRMGISDCVSWEQYPHPHPEPLILKDVPLNTECWDMGCDITVLLTQVLIGKDYKFK